MNESSLISSTPSEAEWALLQILAHPVLFREFINEYDTEKPEWTPLEDHERAWSACSASFIAMCCGRGVHKTTSMIEMLFWWAINRNHNPGDPGLFVIVPNKAQKDPTFFKIRTACLSHWLLKQFVDPNRINQTEGVINFLNGFQFLIRLAGDAGKETNVIGIHTFRIWVDEAQALHWNTWQSLQNCLKKELKGYQMIVSGVPTGERQKNVLYECDQNDPDYNSFNIPRTSMSSWTLENERLARKQYGAELEDSEEYKHFVLGQHGMPTYSVFDRTRFLQKDYKVRKFVINQTMLESYRRIDSDGVSRYHLEEAVDCPPIPTEYGQRPLRGLGYDVGGYTDPTIFFIMVQTQDGSWQNLVRYTIQRVEYALQREILAWLDKVYQFDFMGIDMGGPGKVQFQDLAGELSPYRSYKFYERLHQVEFGGYITVAVDEEGNEKKDQTKRVAVDSLIRWAHEHRFAFSNEDDDLMSELERTKFMRTTTGEPIYRTDNDHQMAAMMCAIMAYEAKYGLPIIVEHDPIKPKLMSARWLDPYEYGSVGW